jgi:hypothetical protein
VGSRCGGCSGGRAPGRAGKRQRTAALQDAGALSEAPRSLNGVNPAHGSNPPAVKPSPHPPAPGEDDDQEDSCKNTQGHVDRLGHGGDTEAPTDPPVFNLAGAVFSLLPERLRHQLACETSTFAWRFRGAQRVKLPGGSLPALTLSSHQAAGFARCRLPKSYQAAPERERRPAEPAGRLTGNLC